VFTKRGAIHETPNLDTCETLGYRGALLMKQGKFADIKSKKESG